ncbi:hypothetical protein FD755_019955 [Muntiacus reevesi]|uniref:Elongin-C n=1 Tax=Muntiacus reevesi TaxID=9886 RepID=A0A5N3X2T9_MUNRE|nr:hypothetical protein FD755_019955 [Muntiacus reevesi]
MESNDGNEKTYGGHESPDAMYVKSVFSDGHAAAAAKLLQSFPTLCDPTDGSPPGSTIPEILQVRTLEWVAISFSNSDCHEFIVEKEHELTSGTIKAMLSGPVNFSEISSHVLPKVCMYFTYKVHSMKIPEFPITPEIALELLIAGNFLDC